MSPQNNCPWLLPQGRLIISGTPCLIGVHHPTHKPNAMELKRAKENKHSSNYITIDETNTNPFLLL
jgi:hypothetical protein